jgi:diaminopimelate epimerase
MEMDMISKMNVRKNEGRRYIGSCCGNSFVIMDCRDIKLSNKFKAGFAMENIVKYNVDSALFVEESRRMNVFMKIFEKDGSESESCGNGTILIAHMLDLKEGKVEMKDNAAIIRGDSKKQSILMSIKFSDATKIEGKKNCLFVKIGEPHIICLVDDLKKFDLVKTGKEMQKNYSGGVNVDAIQKINDSCYRIRTYERGVFAETKSCGTGSLSSYIAISHFDNKLCEESVEFRSAGGSHWVSREKNMLKLETLKKFCKIKII